MNNEDIIKEFEEKFIIQRSGFPMFEAKEIKNTLQAPEILDFLLKALEKKDKEIEALKIINTTLSNLK